MVIGTKLPLTGLFGMCAVALAGTVSPPVLLAARWSLARRMGGLYPLRAGRHVGHYGWRRHLEQARDWRRGAARGLAFLDAKRGFVIGDRGMLLSTVDGGANWQAQPLDTKERLMDITFVGESGWIAGYQGLILHTADGGKTWAKQKTGTTQTLETIFFLDANHGWVVGWAGTILRTSNGGRAWEKIQADAASWSLTSVFFRDTQNGWMVGFAGQILRSRDGGATWKLQTSPVKSWLTAVVFDGANRGWIAYDDGLLLSEDGGETWTTVPVNGRFFLAKLVPVDNRVWAIGQSAVLKQEDTRKWTRITTLVTGTAAPATITPSSTRPTR